MIRKINVIISWPEFGLDGILPVGKHQEPINNENKKYKIRQKTQLLFSANPSISTDPFIKSPICINVQERKKANFNDHKDLL